VDIGKMEAHHEAYLAYVRACMPGVPSAELQEKREENNRTWNALTEEEKEMVLFRDANHLW